MLRRTGALGLIAILTLFIVGCPGSQPSGGQLAKEIKVRRTKQVIKLGDPEQEWQKVAIVEIVDRIPAPRGNAARVGLCWDDDNLYLSFLVRDTELYSASNTRDSITSDDACLVLIEPRPEQAPGGPRQYFGFQVNLLSTVSDFRGLVGQKADTTWESHMQAAISLRGAINSGGAEGYIAEMAIPWADMGIKPEGGKTRFGINLVVYDRDVDEKFFHYIDCGGDSDLSKPTRFVDAVLVK
jgi:hypothetical protein